MASKNFLAVFFVLVFLFSISFIIAQECEVGQIISGKYCDIDGQLQLLKEKGQGCVNNYECIVQSCVDGICEEKFAPIAERTSLLNEMIDFFSGIQCVPGEQKCEGTKLYTCGALRVWEGGADSATCGYNPGGGGGDSSSINIIIYSPQNITYSSKTITLKVGDRNNLAKYWSYSLNGAVKKDFDYTKEQTLNSRLGSNTLDVYAKKTASGSETKKSIVFSIVESSITFYCGDGICDSSESASTCSRDCGEPNPTYTCGNGICESALGESSFNCSGDCQAKKPKNLMWLFWTLVVLIILAIAFIIILIYKKIKKSRTGGASSDIKRMPPKTPPQFQQKPFVREFIKPMQSERTIPVVSSRVPQSFPIQQISRPQPINKPEIINRTQPIVFRATQTMNRAQPIVFRSKQRSMIINKPIRHISKSKSVKKPKTTYKSKPIKVSKPKSVNKSKPVKVSKPKSTNKPKSVKKSTKK